MGNVVRVDFSHQQEPTGERVADCDNGYTRIANELLEALLLADLTKNQIRVVLAVVRKTYGYHKKSDRICNSQLANLTRLPETRISTVKNELVAMKVLFVDGRKIGINKTVSSWLVGNSFTETVNNSFTETVNKKITETVNDEHESFTETVKKPLPKLSNTKETIQKKERKDPPITPQGETLGAAEVLGFYQEQVGSTKCRRTAEIEIILNAGYSVEDCKLVIRWGLANWRRGGKSYANLNNLFRKTRFDGYLADADVWAQGQTDRNPAPCPHQEIIALWNKQFSCRQIELFQWTKNRPAYRNLERVWNEKNNKGRDRDLGQIEKLFSLLAASTLTADLPNKAWLTLDWILEPRNWARCYEQITREYKQRNGLQS